MLYIIDHHIQPIAIEQITNKKITVGCITMEELQKIYLKFGFSLSAIKECTNDHIHYRNYMNVYDEFSFGIINRINFDMIYKDRHRIGFFLSTNAFFVVNYSGEDDWTRQAFTRALRRFKPENITLEKVVYSFMDEVVYHDDVALEHMEYKINLLEDGIVAGMIHQNFNTDLLDMKKQLLIMRGYYEQLLNIAEHLQGDENDLFEDDKLRFLHLFYEKVSRLSHNTQILRENLVQLREAHDAYLNFCLNQIMKVFTVVTTIFLPLTLIVGWYGMNFTTMPEIRWRYGYLFVIAISILVVIICIVFFKKKKLL